MSSIINKKIDPSLKFVYSDNNSLSVIFHDNDLLMGVAGEFNKNLKELEKIIKCSLYSRGNSILIKSNSESNEIAKNAIQFLATQFINNGTIESKDIIFSGVQPTGEIHIGNYLGAISQFVSHQDRYKSIFSIVDLHAITIWQDPSELLNSTRKVLAIFLASGIDPVKNIIFNQSQVAEHTQLAWVLSCIAKVGWLNRMTQFKDKAGKNI